MEVFLGCLFGTFFAQCLFLIFQKQFVLPTLERQQEQLINNALEKIVEITKSEIGGLVTGGLKKLGINQNNAPAQYEPRNSRKFKKSNVDKDIFELD